MIQCPSCDAEVHPFQDLTEQGKVVDVCPKCNSRIKGADAGSVAAVIPLRKAPTPTPPHSPESADPLSMIRARCIALRGEVVALENKRRELAMYERMLIAADDTEDSISVRAEYVRPAPHQMNGTH